MELKQLNQFVVLSEVLSFRKAAARLHMAQPPLSMSIKALENELGVRLFERLPTGVEITEDGQRLLADARRALYYAQQVRDTARMSVQGRVGPLKVHFVASSTIQLLPRAIAAFRAAQPGVVLRLSESTSDLITSALRECRIDIGLVRYPAEIDHTLSMEMVEQNQLVVALPMTHRLADRTSLALEELRNEPFIFFEKLDASTTHAIALQACQDAGFFPNIVQQVAHAQTLLSLVEIGMGVALVPDAYQSLSRRQMRFVPMTTPLRSPIGIALLCRKDELDRPLIRSFRECLAPVLSDSALHP